MQDKPCGPDGRNALVGWAFGILLHRLQVWKNDLYIGILRFRLPVLTQIIPAPSSL